MQNFTVGANQNYFIQIRITLNSIGAIKTLDQDEKQLQEVVRYAAVTNGSTES